MGEGSYEASRDYKQRTEEYMKKADVEADAEAAKPRSEQEARDLETGRGRRPLAFQGRTVGETLVMPDLIRHPCGREVDLRGSMDAGSSPA